MPENEVINPLERPQALETPDPETGLG